MATGFGSWLFEDVSPFIQKAPSVALGSSGYRRGIKGQVSSNPKEPSVPFPATRLFQTVVTWMTSEPSLTLEPLIFSSDEIVSADLLNFSTNFFNFLLAALNRGSLWF